jgi:hypothetical protein
MDMVSGSASSEPLDFAPKPEPEREPQLEHHQVRDITGRESRIGVAREPVSVGLSLGGIDEEEACAIM